MLILLFVTSEAICQSSCTLSMLESTECHLECMSEACNFQNLNQNCFELCLSSGCTLDLLMNKDCDSICNTRQCGWDYGSCGFCSKDCLLVDLPSCKSACLVPECLESTACQEADECNPGCKMEMLGNGVCNEECLNRICNFDLLDCSHLQISENCYLIQVGDGICDDDCFNDQAYWDGWDCSCAAGCTDDLLSNDNCDSECNTEKCNFDSEKCLECAPGCQGSLLGDGNCDMQCLTIECYFDFGDCDCASYCNTFLISNQLCDAACNNINCGFDANICNTCASGCNSTYRHNDNCESECNVQDCLFDDYDCICSLGCLSSFQGNGTCEESCNTFECIYDSGDCSFCEPECPPYLLGDGKCDSECNTQSCHYDDFDCLCQPGCTSEKLNNNICDLECNHYLCNFDNNNCIPCQCDLRLIGNGACDADCNNSQCFYDAGDCQCPSSCTSQKLSNSLCDSECNSPLCNYDNFKCQECAPGCKWTDINNGECQVACTVSECGFDGSDCSCSEDCEVSSLVNRKCEETCNKSKCLYDNQACLECAAGCPILSINDGICQSECYTTECGFDGFDCLCSSYCESLTSCDLTCITPECDYSRQVCENSEILRNLVYQGTSPYPITNWNPEPCKTFNETCLLLMMDETCDNNCNIESCLWDLGGCSTCSNSLCKRCIEDYCIRCIDGFFSFWGTCLEYIPLSASVDPARPWFLLPRPERSSLKSPIKIYVSASKQSRLETGRLSNPFSSFSVALSSVFSKFTNIYLMKGIHQLGVIDLTNPNVLNKDSDVLLLNTVKTFKVITISTLLCSEEATPGCSDEPAVILYNDPRVIFNVKYSATLIMKNLVFNGGFSLRQNCLQQNCYYCPYLKEKNHVFYNDKDQPVNPKLPTTNCDDNRNRSFISFSNGGSLYLTNVTFYNFRQQFKSIIDISRVSATFVNVSFLYVQASNSSDSAVIFQKEGSFVWVLGLAKFVNYGYENVDGLRLSPLLRADDSTMVKLKYLLFDWNVVLGNDSALLKIKNIQNFAFEYSQVTFNRGSNLIHVEVLKNGQMMHLVMTNLRFFNNLAESGSLILMEFSQVPRTVFLDRCEFLNNTLDNGLGLLSLTSKQESSFYESHILLSNLKFDNNAGGQVSCLNIESLSSVNLSNIQIFPARPLTGFPSESWVNASKASGFYFKVYKKVNFTSSLSSLRILGVKNEVFIENLQVHGQTSEKIIILSKNNKIQLNFCQFLSNFPQHSVIFLEENQESVLSNSQFLNTTSLLSCVFLLNQGNNHLFQVQFAGNQVRQGTVKVENSDLNIARSQFIENSAEEGSALFIKLASSRTLSLHQTQFISNMANEGTLLVSHSEVTEKLLTLLINMNSFLNNSAASGSGIFAESLTLSDESIILNTEFKFNKGSKLGVLVLKENTIHLNNCQIRLNQAQQASALYFENLLNSETRNRITNSIFSNNSGESVIYASSLQVFTNLLMSGVAFINNTGHCLQVFKSNVELNSTYFVANSYTHAPCVHSTNSLISMRDSQIMYNQGSEIGALRISSYSVISIFNCTFYFNIGYNGGCMYVSELGQFNIENSKFLNNISPGYGSALFILDTGNNKNTIKNSIITDNIIGISGVISSLGGSVELYDTIIQGNKAYGFSPGISSSMGNLTMYRCICSSQSGWVGSFVSSTSLSYIKLFDSVFKNASATQGGALLISTSYLTSINCSFSNISAELGGVAQIMSASEGYFLDTITQNSTASGFGGIFNIIQSKLTLINSNFKGFHDKGIYADKAPLISIKNSSFSEGLSSENGGLLLCIACTEIIINETSVSNISSFKGGALSIVFQENQKKPSCLIENSVFSNISAVTAGVISSVDYNLSIKNSEFYNNSAFGSSDVWGSGGVVQSSCDLNNECDLLISESVFMYNFARENGGCIEWKGKEPKMTDNLFSDNFATYGNNIASFPVKLQLFQNGEIVNSLNLTDIPPGQKIEQNVSVALVDHYQQIVKTDNQTSASLALDDSEAFVTGDTSEVSSEGLIVFNDFIIYADINSVQSLVISSESVESLVTVEVYMRNCSLGESFSNGACLVCTKGQYNLEPNGPCLECPSSAYCFGNYSMVPKKNYWRSSMYSTIFHRCPLLDTCLGGEDDTSLTGNCAKGYKSNMCQSCESGYSRSTGNLCQKCPDMKKNIIYLSLIAVFIILVVCGLVYVNISMANKPASNYTILIKILLNYIQIIGIVASMNLDWPDFALDYLKIQETAGSLSQQSFSFDCFVSEKYNRSNSQVYFDKILLYLMMPLVLTAVCLFLWSVVSLVRLDSKFIKNHFVGSVVIIALLLHSILIKICFSPFSCRDIEGELYLNDDLSIRCWTGNHKVYTLTVALPGAIIWGLFVPFVVLFFVIRNKRSFEELAVKQRYGFVIAGYQKSTYYWEIVILYRKTLVITASIVFGGISIELQTLSVLIILLLASYMQSDLKPFLGDSMNKMEFRSILVSIVTIYCGLYYLSSDVSWTGRIFLFVILVIVNTIFFTYWAYYFVKDFSVSAWIFIKEIMLRRRKSVIPESSNQTPKFKDGEVQDSDSDHIIDTSENHEDHNDQRLSLKRSLKEEAKVEDLENLEDDEEELANSAIFIKEGKKVSALSLVVKPANKTQLKESRNTVRYNAFADDSD